MSSTWGNAAIDLTLAKLAYPNELQHLPGKHLDGRCKRTTTVAERIDILEKPSSEWVINVGDRLMKNPMDYDTGRTWSIHRVPANMLKVQEKPFVPKIISIGPFRYGLPGLQLMEQHKMRYLLRLVADPKLCEVASESDEQPGSSSTGTFLQVLEKDMRLLEKRTRMSYSEEFNHISSDEFVKMMIVDGCFVIELLRLYHTFDSPSWRDVDDPILATRWMPRTLQRDILMLENQLPFFVLQKLFQLTSRTAQEHSLIELVMVFFDPLLPRESLSLFPNEKSIRKPELRPVEENEEEYDHILDVFLSTFLYPFKDKATTSKWNSNDRNMPLVEERQLIHSATELMRARIRLKRRENHHLLDVSFKNGVLEILTLNVDGNTQRLLLNFLAYEQCDEDAKPSFTNYFMFLDSMINSPKDIRVLHQNGIINHAMGSDEDAANFFNTICREIVYDLDECYLSEQFKGVNASYKEYNDSMWKVWWTDLKLKYVSSPWTSLSLVAAILLLILGSIADSFYYDFLLLSNELKDPFASPPSFKINLDLFTDLHFTVNPVSRL